jgi:hypothetical protein
MEAGVDRVMLAYGMMRDITPQQEMEIRGQGRGIPENGRRR